jgi:hypothetical protein
MKGGAAGLIREGEEEGTKGGKELLEKRWGKNASFILA